MKTDAAAFEDVAIVFFILLTPINITFVLAGKFIIPLT